MKRLIPLLLLIVFLSACATQEPDQKVDSQLGLAHEEEAGEAVETLSSLEERQQLEQKRQLERQISDSLQTE